MHGSRFTADLAKAIENCELVLFLASRNSYESRYTIKEVNYAINKGKNILPYIIDDSVLPAELDFLLSDVNWAFMKEHPIETVLMDDISSLLNHHATSNVVDYEDEALSLYDQGRYSESFAYFEKAAQKGSASAQYSLGVLYYNGDGVDKDPTKAIQWLTQAAMNDSTKAMLLLGKIYNYGWESVSEEVTKAIRWFNAAAAYDVAEAYFELGNIYYSKEGYINYKKAAELFERAVELGDMASKNPLAILRANGLV